MQTPGHSEVTPGALLRDCANHDLTSTKRPAAVSCGLSQQVSMVVLDKHHLAHVEQNLYTEL